MEKFANMKPVSKQPEPPDVESAAVAYELGHQARRRNAKRTQWPAQWRDQPNIEAWIAGWDSADETIRESES